MKSLLVIYVLMKKGVYLAISFLLVQSKEDLKIVPHGTLNINIHR
jgi:hypothetical protein